MMNTKCSYTEVFPWRHFSMDGEGRRKKYKKMGIHASILVACAIAHREGRRRHNNISRSLRLESESVRSEMLTHSFSNTRYCRSIIRMSPLAFLNLCKMLTVQGGLRPTKRATIEEQVIKSIYLLGHYVTNRELLVFFFIVLVRQLVVTFIVYLVQL